MFVLMLMGCVEINLFEMPSTGDECRMRRLGKLELNSGDFGGMRLMDEFEHMMELNSLSGGLKWKLMFSIEK